MFIWIRKCHQSLLWHRGWVMDGWNFQFWVNCPFKSIADLHYNLNMSTKAALFIWPLLSLCPSSTMASCSIPAGDCVCGHHRLTGPAGFFSAGLSAVLSDQSEEEGQEGCRPWETCPKCWQREWRRGLQTGWRDNWLFGGDGDGDGDDLYPDITQESWFPYLQVVKNITKLSEHSQADVTEKSQSTEVDIKVRLYDVSNS